MIYSSLVYAIIVGDKKLITGASSSLFLLQNLFVGNKDGLKENKHKQLNVKKKKKKVEAYK